MFCKSNQRRGEARIKVTEKYEVVRLLLFYVGLEFTTKRSQTWEKYGAE